MKDTVVATTFSNYEIIIFDNEIFLNISCSNKKTRRPPKKNSDKYSKLKQIHVISCDEEKKSLKANSVHVRLAYLFRLINVAFVYVYRCLYRGCIKTFVTYAYVYPIV